MFGIGGTELAIIVVFGFLLFGPDKLPGMGRTIGRMLRQFREAQEGFTQVVQTEVMDPLQEAMADPASKEAKAKADERAAALAEDEDADDVDGERRMESFAERRERLRRGREAKAAAELKEKEAKAKAEEDVAEDTPAEEVSSDQKEDVQEVAEAKTAPKTPSAKDLYALKPNKED